MGICGGGGDDDDRGYYDLLRHSEEGTPRGACDGSVTETGNGKRWHSISWWIKVAILGLGAAGIAVAVAVLVGPLVLKKVVAPIIQWESTNFSKPVLALILFAGIALLPSLMIPSCVFMWVAGMNFGYGYGFLLIIVAMTIGVSLPFFIGSLFRHKIQYWLEKWPKQAPFVRLAGEGDWMHQFKAVILLRISPFPYILLNYASVAANVKYGPYISGSIVGNTLDAFVQIYSGRLLKTVVEATDQGTMLSMEQIVFNAIAITAAVASTAVLTMYAKRALQALKEEDELR